MLILDNLYVTYGNKPILSYLSFKFEEGKIYGLIGENGIGKTTLLNAISNTISYKGKIYLLKEKNYLQSLNILPSELFFYPKIKGIEYIELFLKAKNIKNVNINKWNQKYNLPLNEYISTYSTGMKKKVALMSLFMLDSKILLLDEPFNGLSLEAIKIVIEDLIEYIKNLNNIIIIVSHNLDVLNSITKKVYRLEKNKLTIIKNHIQPK